MADNLDVTAGSGSTIGMDEVVDGTLGTVKVGFGKIMDGTLDSTNKLVVNSSGEATVKDTAAEASLSSIDGKITAVNTGAVVVSSSALPSGAATAAKQPALGTAGSASSDVITVQGIASMTALKTDGSGVTQPVSGTVTVQQSTASNLKVDLSSTAANSTAIKVDNSAVTQPVSGTVTSNQGGTWNVGLSKTGAGYSVSSQTALTTAATVSSASGKFGGAMFINLNSAPAYIQVFDTTGAVTLGTTTPTFVIPVPANSTAANGVGFILPLDVGINIANGIKVAATTTATGSTTVSTGLTGFVYYS